jgi:hypothetical protein
MRWWALEVGADDSLFRGFHFPKAFTEGLDRSGADRIRHQMLAPYRAIHLTYDDTTRSIQASVVWQRLAPLSPHVHNYGCRLSARRNEQLPSGNYPADIYCGAYELTLRRVRTSCLISSIGEVISVEAIHAIEANGEIAHANLTFFLAASTDDDDVESVKTALLDRLWKKVLRGPLRHVCRADQAIRNHPSEKLVVPPQGNYGDSRSRFALLCDLFSYFGVSTVLCTRTWCQSLLGSHSAQ